MILWFLVSRYKNDVRVAHFIGAVKPWHYNYTKSIGQVQLNPDAGPSIEFLSKWWKMFLKIDHGGLVDSMVRIILCYILIL